MNTWVIYNNEEWEVRAFIALFKGNEPPDVNGPNAQLTTVINGVALSYRPGGMKLRLTGTNDSVDILKFEFIRFVEKRT